MPDVEVTATSRYESRKFLLACATSAAVTAFFALAKLTPAEYIDSLKWIVGLYLGANVAQKATAK